MVCVESGETFNHAMKIPKVFKCHITKLKILLGYSDGDSEASVHHRSICVYALNNSLF